MTRKLLLGLAIVFFGNASAWSQLVATSELFGEGVHRYFARDYQTAEQLLTQAIDSGSQDPRAFYFRGLCRETFGGGGEVDFQEGARLEATGRSGPQIGLALVRVQGPARAKLEKARREARLQAAQQKALSQPVVPPVAPMVQPEISPANSDPFKNEGLRSGDTQAAPTKPAPDATVDPFKDEPAKTDADPFSSPAPANDSDPFSTPAAPADDDPFK
jgi:hypothetical protein